MQHMKLFVLLATANLALSHYAMSHPAPDKGIVAGEQKDFYGTGISVENLRSAAYWFNTGTQIGCEKATGASCRPGVAPEDCCGGTAEPTIPEDYRTWKTLPQQKAILEKNGLNATYIEQIQSQTKQNDAGALYYGPGMARNPWNAPGLAPVLDACGVFFGFNWPNLADYPCGLSKPGGPPEQFNGMTSVNKQANVINAPCGTAEGRSEIESVEKLSKYPRGTLGSGIVDKFLKTGEGTQPLTPWVIGETAKVAQSYWVANHGGGYQFRLCPEKDFSSDGEANEKCFQANPLDYASPNSWVEYKDGTKSKPFPAKRFTEGVLPKGSTWSVLQVPNCILDGFHSCVGGNANPLAFQFPEAVKGIYSSFPVFWAAGKELIVEVDTFSYWDSVKVPSDLPAGRYVLGWRWDSENSAQVWANCAVIQLVEASATGASHYATSATVNHFTDTQFGAVAAISAVALIALGAFAVTFSRISGQKSGIQAPLTEKTQYSSI